jgi:dTDP-4-dehydrorhamnose 3,5-epimerase
MPFRFTELELAGVILVEPRVFADERGFFMETYKHRDYVAAGLTETFMQENHSRSGRGSLRGLHYQRAPAAQGKLVRAIVGEIYDVAVDIRPDSPMFGRWVGVTLSADNRRMLFVPPWCAHGFCVVSECAEVVYKTTAEYAPELEGGLMWNDPEVAIAWPIGEPILSERDRRWPDLAALAGVSTHVVEV